MRSFSDWRGRASAHAPAMHAAATKARRLTWRG
jgi:hypothetical protein